ncbi:hypothetical protein DFH27DRAFT_651226 [Peziza echinospora]|nr:hypothetical protein DFH27DRAFT_651226 [Peziza echinospora]
MNRESSCSGLVVTHTLHVNHQLITLTQSSTLCMSLISHELYKNNSTKPTSGVQFKTSATPIVEGGANVLQASPTHSTYLHNTYIQHRLCDIPPRPLAATPPAEAIATIETVTHHLTLLTDAVARLPTVTHNQQFQQQMRACLVGRWDKGKPPARTSNFGNWPASSHRAAHDAPPRKPNPTGIAHTHAAPASRPAEAPPRGGSSRSPDAAMVARVAALDIALTQQHQIQQKHQQIQQNHEERMQRMQQHIQQNHEERMQQLNLQWQQAHEQMQPFGKRMYASGNASTARRNGASITATPGPGGNFGGRTR